MSQKIKAPNQKSSGFLWGIVAIVVIAVVVIAVVVVQGRKSTDSTADLARADVSFDVSFADDTITLKKPGTPDSAPVADIYQDFACIHCADLVEADHASMLKALNDGTLVVNMKFTGFVDGGEKGSSTRGTAVAVALARTGDAGAFWALHEKAFLDRGNVLGWNYGQYADALENLGVEAATVDAVRDESVNAEGLSVTEANGKALQDKMGDKAGTPALFVDGEQIQIQKDPNDALKMKDWIPDVVK